MSEHFQPPAHTPPDTFIHWVLFYARVGADFQVNTVYKHMRIFLPGLTGRVVDVGAGECPYRHLVNDEVAEYCGIDSSDAERFGYNNTAVTHFDGEHIPYGTSSIDHFICTEVIEHLPDPQPIITEMHRVLKPGGTGVVTVPWSARFHYIPYDYHRFTPTTLGMLFSAFSSVKIEPRGTDITVIVSKIMVAYLRLLAPKQRSALVVTIFPALLFVPVIILCVILGHLSLLLNLGSTDDPLGYTVWVQK